MEQGLFSLKKFNLAIQSLGTVKVVGIVVVSAVILGCSPKLDWRAVNTERLGYSALFPEKPKQAERTLPYAGISGRD
jgi:hypothetical protein